MLFATPFILMGVVALLLALYGLVTRQLDLKAGEHLLTIMVVCAGVSLLIIGWFATKRTKPGLQLKARHPDRPWMWREDWAAGRVANSRQRAIFFLWVFVVFFNLMALVFGGILVLRGSHFGPGTAWLGLLFPVVGLAVLLFAIHATRAWRRFGKTVLTMSALPVPPGAVLAGEIRVPVRLLPEQAFYLRLSCVRSTTALRGKTRVTIERILWQEEKWFRPSLPQTEPGLTRLPVWFPLPASLPETTGTPVDGVQWRLEASAKVRGPDFHASFEIPVYQPVETPAELGSPAAAPVAVPGAGGDPSQPWQLTLDEIRREIHSRIVMVDRSDGREFHFPAARNPGFAIGASVLWLIWTGAIVAMVWSHAPLLFPVVFLAVDALMSIFVADLWFRRSQVRVTPAQVELQTAWLTLKKATTIPSAEVASLKADIGATAGHAAYYDLKLKTRAGREYTLAKNLGHKPEADWLIREMAAVLKQRPQP